MLGFRNYQIVPRELCNNRRLHFATVEPPNSHSDTQYSQSCHAMCIITTFAPGGLFGIPSTVPCHPTRFVMNTIAFTYGTLAFGQARGGHEFVFSTTLSPCRIQRFGWQGLCGEAGMKSSHKSTNVSPQMRRCSPPSILIPNPP
jgi:hypothetical protein